MRPEAAFLTFTEHRLATLMAVNGLRTAAALAAYLRTTDRTELAQRATGAHAQLEAALAYARREGPALVVTPDGRLLRVERERDAAEDARIAAEERAYSERLRRMTLRDELGRAARRT